MKERVGGTAKGEREFLRGCIASLRENRSDPSGTRSGVRNLFALFRGCRRTSTPRLMSGNSSGCSEDGNSGGVGNYKKARKSLIE